MKNYVKYLIFSVFTIASFSSCEDFFELETPLGQMDAQQVYGDPKVVNARLNAAFSTMGKSGAYRDRVDRYFGGANTDIERYKSLEAQGGEVSLMQYNSGINNTQYQFDKIWGNVYTIIGLTNEVVVNLAQNERLSPNNEIGALYAKALTYRAYFYFDLIRWWGDVPARFEPVTEETMYLPKTDRNEIYERIIDDLKIAEDYIDWAGEGNAKSNSYFSVTTEFPTKAAIKAFRARISLAAAGYAQYPKNDPVARKFPLVSREWGGDLQCNVARVSEERRRVLLTEARDACLEVYEQDGNLPPFESVFRDAVAGKNGFEGEVLWQMLYDSEKLRQMGNRHDANNGFGDVSQGGNYYVMPNFFFDFEEGDTRRDVTCMPVRWRTANNQELGKVNEWSFGKRRREWMNAKVTGNSVVVPNIVIRYADVLLMLAESENELNGPGSAGQYLLEVRQRAFKDGSKPENASMIKGKAIGSLSKEEFFNAIVDERAFEFAGECLRQADLIRWGLLKTKIDEAMVNLDKLKNKAAPYDWVPDVVYSRKSTHALSAFVSDYFAAAIPTMTVLDIYGLNRGETNDPGEGWTAASADDVWGENRANAAGGWSEYLYVNNPDERQLYPVIPTITSGTNGFVTDDYGYYTGK